MVLYSIKTHMSMESRREPHIPTCLYVCVWDMNHQQQQTISITHRDTHTNVQSNTCTVTFYLFGQLYGVGDR